MTPKTLIVIRKPPFGNLDSWEGLRLSLSFYAAGAPVAVLLEGRGVFNWISGMKEELEDPHSVSRLIEDVTRVGIPVFLVHDDLVRYGLSQSDLASSHPKIVSQMIATMLLTDYKTIIAV